MELESAPAHRVTPERRQQVQHALRVAEAAERTEGAAEKRHHHPFAQQQSPYLPWREAKGQQGAGLARALLQPELEQ